MDHAAHNRIGAVESHFGYQPVVYPFCGVCLLFQPLILVGLQTHADKAFYFRGDHTRGSQIVLADTGHGFSLAILLDGLSGYAKPFCD